MDLVYSVGASTETKGYQPVHINGIAELVRMWADGNESILRVWLFGSRVRGDHREDSDIDIAIDVIGKGVECDSYSVWLSKSEKWQQELDQILPMEVQIEWWGAEETPTIERGLSQSSILVFARGDV